MRLVVSRLSVLVSVFAFSLAFDFKAPESGGTLTQYSMSALALISGSLICLSAPIPAVQRMNKRILRGCILLGLFFVTVAFSQLINQNSLYVFASVILPYVLFAVGVLVALKLNYVGFPEKFLVTSLVLSGIASIIFRFIYAFLYLQVEMDTVRWQILSPALPFVFAFGLARVVLARRLTFLGMAALVIPVVSAIVSVTRGYLLVVIACIIGTWLSLTAQARASNAALTKAVLKIMVRFVPAALTGMIALVIALWLRPDILTQWNVRLQQRIGAGVSSDLTWLAREAEMKGMLEDMTTPAIWTIGKGIGATYFYSSNFRSELGPALSRVPFEEDLPYSNDVFWVYHFFAVGILGAFFFYYFIVLSFVLSYRKMKSMARLFTEQAELAMPFIAICGVIAGTLTGNPFGERFGGLLLGVCLGLAYSWRASNEPGRRVRQSGVSNLNRLFKARNDVQSPR
jgi:hypothetical protein